MKQKHANDCTIEFVNAVAAENSASLHYQGVNLAVGNSSQIF